MSQSADENHADGDSIGLSLQIQIDRACDTFERTWKSAEGVPEIAPLLQDHSGEDQQQLGYELLAIDRHYRAQRGLELSEDEYRQRMPQLAAAINRLFLPSTEPQPTLDDHSTLPLVADKTKVSPARAAAAELPGGKIRYFGDYELLGEIARGGMGVVYRARQISLNRIIALKMILSGQIAGADEIRRFQFEAEAAANLDHPGIVPIYDIGEHQGQHYFSMKLIDGKTLGDLSDELERDHDHTIYLVARIADAVHHAHQRGILHRDLKPGNVLIDDNGQPLITDFGLARDTKSTEQHTRTGAVVGTPGFMSPEQANGKQVTTATDIYSLGAILFQLFRGRPASVDRNLD